MNIVIRPFAKQARTLTRTMTLCYLVLLAALALPPAQAVSVGDTAPDWVMTSTAGESINLYQQLEQGKHVVLVFWATWCRYCRDLLPELDQLQQELAQAPVVFYALNVWEDSDPVSYMEKHNMRFIQLLNADNTAKRYNIRGTPGIVVVGPDKRVRYKRIAGEKNSQVMQSVRNAIQ